MATEDIAGFGRLSPEDAKFFLCYLGIEPKAMRPRSPRDTWKILHPNALDRDAQRQGMRAIDRVRKKLGVRAILDAYGLDEGRIAGVIEEGLNAEIIKHVSLGGGCHDYIAVPDRNTRGRFVRMLAELRGLLTKVGDAPGGEGGPKGFTELQEEQAQLESGNIQDGEFEDVTDKPEGKEE